jgi:thymidylate synthase ThyX
MQHGGRDNDWRHANFTIPETIRRAELVCDEKEHLHDADVVDCIRNVDALMKFKGTYSLGKKLRDTVKLCKETYAALVDAGIPCQDARRFLPIGLQTYVFADYNWLALKGLLSNRLEHVMDWEINCVAQLMAREVKRLCPSFMGEQLMSHSDRRQTAAFSKMDSWPPDGKYPVSQEDTDRKRTHRPEQMPYWVLAPESMDGDDIRWIRTNGTYPHEEAGSGVHQTSDEGTSHPVSPTGRSTD